MRCDSAIAVAIIISHEDSTGYPHSTGVMGSRMLQIVDEESRAGEMTATSECRLGKWWMK